MTARSANSARESRTTRIAWTRRILAGALVASVLVVAAGHLGADRWAGHAPDCERAAETGRERLDARLRAARREGSVEHVLCVAEALAAMGDGEAVRNAVRVAEQLAGSDAETRADVRAFRERFSEWVGAPVADGAGAVTVRTASPPAKPDRLARTGQNLASAVTACQISGRERAVRHPSTRSGNPS